MGSDDCGLLFRLGICQEPDGEDPRHRSARGEKNSATVSDSARFEISHSGSAAGDLVVGITAGGNAVLTTERTIEKNTDPASVGADVAVEIPIGSATKKFVRLRVEE